MGAISPRRVAEAVAIAALVLTSISGSILLIARFTIRGVWWLDYGVFRAVGLLPLAEIYSNTPPTPPFIYPPPSLLIFRLFGKLPIGVELFLWIVGSVSLFLFAARKAGWKALALTSVSAPLAKSILIGQSSIMLGGLVLLATSRRGWAMGALLGVVAAVKPQIVLMAPLALLIRRDSQAFVAMGVAGLAACLAATALFGFDRWAEWISAIPAFQQVLIEGGVLRYLVSPAGVAQYWGLPSLPFHLAGAALGLTAIAGAARKAEGIELAALVVTASLLASPYALATDVIPILPFLACVALKDTLGARTVAAILIMSMLHVGAGLVLLGAYWSLSLRGSFAGRPALA